MTVKELIELLRTYVIADSRNADVRVTNDSYISYDSLEFDRDENEELVVVIY